MDSTNALTRALPIVCAAKAEIQSLLSATAAAVPGFTWTGIATGAFLDWGLREGFILDVRGRKGILYGNGGDGSGNGNGGGSGEVPFSATTLEDVGKAVVAVVERGVGFNRVVRVHSAVVTQGQLLGYARGCCGEEEGEWEVEVKNTDSIRESSLEVLGREGVEKEEVDTAILGLCAVGTWGAGYGGHFTCTDNEILGIDVLSEDGVRGVVRGVVREVCG